MDDTIAGIGGLWYYRLTNLYLQDQKESSMEDRLEEDWFDVKDNEYILDEELGELAIRLALPTITAMVPGMSWGPAGAAIMLKLPDLNPIVHVMDDLDRVEYDEYRFMAIATAKTHVSYRTGRPSGQVVAMDPAALMSADSKYQGSATLGSISAAVSGFKGTGDQWSAFIVCAVAQNLAHQVLDNIQKRDGVWRIGDHLEEARAAVLASYDGMDS